ncbi:MAG: hypothetical protein ACRD2Y_10045 [Terriglobales bacterium]
MSAPNFEIYISGYAEAQRAAELVGSGLTPGEKEAARKFGLTEDQYQRSKLALAEQSGRIHARAVDLGELTQSILAPLGEGYRLVALARNIDTASWTLQLQTPQGTRNVVVSWELADVLDSRTAQELNRLKNLVLFALGRQELIFKR